MRPPSTATVATGTPLGICTIESSESRPESAVGADRDADHRQRGHRREHPRQVRRAAGPGHDHPQPAPGGRRGRTRSCRGASGGPRPPAPRGRPRARPAPRRPAPPPAGPSRCPSPRRRAGRAAHSRTAAAAPARPGQRLLRGGRRARSRGPSCAGAAPRPCRRGARARRARPAPRASAGADGPARSPSRLTMAAAGARIAVSPSGRPSTPRRWFSNCEVSAGLDGVVAGVVGAGGDLVDQHLAPARKSSTPVTPTPPAVSAAARASSDAARRSVLRDRGRHQDLVADVVALARLHHRVGEGAGVGPARDHDRQLALERHQPLGQHARRRRRGGLRAAAASSGVAQVALP